MEDYTVTIDLPPHRRGDWWQGITSIGPILVDGETPLNPLTRIRMQFRKRSGDVYTFDSDSSALPDSPITITDANSWVATIPPVEKFMQVAGTWDWDMEFYSESFPPLLTFYKGSLEVTQDVSR